MQGKLALLMRGGSMKNLPNTDILDIQFIEEAIAKPGPWVTISMPTDRAARDTRGQSIQYNNLLNLAAERLKEQGYEDVDGLLAEARALDSSHFWWHQADSLVVFVAPGYTRYFRLSLELADEVSVDTVPRLRPIAALLSESGVFRVLALSQNSVRLFGATRRSIGEIDLGDTPRSAKDMQTGREKQLQHSPQSTGGGRVNFHGHADDGSADLERFFRRVAAGVDEALGRSMKHPLVLAAVAEHRPLFAPLTKQWVLDKVIAGNHDNSDAVALHRAAMPIVQEVIADKNRELLERFGALLGTGKASEQIQSVERAAEEGRVDTLILSAAPTVADGQADIIQDRADRIIVNVLRNSGSIVVIEDESDSKVRAIYRH